MKIAKLVTVALACVLVSGCSTVGGRAPKATTHPDHPVAQREALFELLRYVYLWHFDDSFSIIDAESDTIKMWVREVHFELDDGDKSRFAEVWFPQINMLINLKKANYSIPELGVDVRNNSFKIQNVIHRSRAGAPQDEYHVVTFSQKEVADHLFSTRNLKRFPDEVLRRNLRTAMIEREYDAPADITGNQIVHVSPISPVSNDLWVYHENLKHLIRFSADMDLNNPSYWSDTPIHVEVYDLDTAVVVSPDEMPGSDAYLTKDFTGRALFNCMILGMRIEVPQADARKALREVQAAENSE